MESLLLPAPVCYLFCVLFSSKVGKYVTVGGQECLNLASLNFLGMIGRPEIEVGLLICWGLCWGSDA